MVRLNNNEQQTTMVVSNDGFETVKKACAKQKQRVCIGNLSQDCTVQDLVELLQSADTTIHADELVVSRDTNSCVVQVARPDTIIAKLHRTMFQNKRLVVQRERTYHTTKTKPTNPLASSWQKPTQTTTNTLQNVRNEPSSPNEQGKRESLLVTSVDTDGSMALEQADEDASHTFEMTQTMSELLQDYGEQDVDWKQKIIPDTSVESTTANNTSVAPIQYDNRLGQHGKAPIHILFSSFGFYHGAPPSNGWSHAHPLPVQDVRALRPVPHYLVWQDGLSGAVKHTLLKLDNAADATDTTPKLKETCKELAERVATCMAHAIADGHGYASPLCMVVHVGSESGTHRSVVACELGATALRKLLRANRNNRFQQPCSVGTFHRDIEKQRANKTKSAGKTSANKQKELEDDW
jgi:RNase adaptor protein for sRNA GlmZ degradation